MEGLSITMRAANQKTGFILHGRNKKNPNNVLFEKKIYIKGTLQNIIYLGDESSSHSHRVKYCCSV